MAKVKLKTTMGHRSVQATLFGAWAVHRAFNTDLVVETGLLADHSKWNITHAPTGMSAARYVAELEREDAVRIACALDRSHEFDDAIVNKDDAREIFEGVVGLALETPS